MAKKILVVDDEANIVKSLSDLLKSKGYVVVTAMDGKEGIDAVKREKPDLILLDIMMPKLSGLELLKRVKENLKSVNIPIIILTAKSDKESLAEAMENYAEKFITKPYDPQDILRSVENALKNAAS